MTLDLFPGGADLIARVAEQLAPTPDPYSTKPVEWVKSELGEWVWSGQQKILESVRDHKYTAVRSAHSIGKSHIASRAIAWWVATHPVNDVFVVSTAPSAPQVKAILWRYLKAIHRKHNLPGYITEAEVPEWKIDGNLVGWGRKPADVANEDSSTAFQGIHAKYVLVVLDEAGGIDEWLWNSVDTLVTSPTNRVLAIGNPDDPASHFEKVNRPGSGWNTLKISAYDAPAFTGEVIPEELTDKLVSVEWVEERKRAWGEDSPLFISKVLAEFPDTAEDNLIQVAWINAAKERDFSGEAVADLGKGALDVARQGRDESVFAYNRAGHYRTVRTRRGIGDLMRLVGWLSQFSIDHPAVPFIIDSDGLGAGVFDRARELGIPVTPFYAGRKAYEPRRFGNRRSEQWWKVRELFQAGLFDIDPEDEDLQAQLTSIKYTEDSAGRIWVETKKEMRARGLPSPDRADTLMMITAPADDWTELYTEEHEPGRRRNAETITGDLLQNDIW